MDGKIRLYKEIRTIPQLHYPVFPKLCSNVDAISLNHFLNHQNFIECVCFRIHQSCISHTLFFQAQKTNIKLITIP
jgi:hypothetical protein